MNEGLSFAPSAVRISLNSGDGPRFLPSRDLSEQAAHGSEKLKRLLLGGLEIRLGVDLVCLKVELVLAFEDACRTLKKVVRQLPIKELCVTLQLDHPAPAGGRSGTHVPHPTRVFPPGGYRVSSQTIWPHPCRPRMFLHGFWIN